MIFTRKPKWRKHFALLPRRVGEYQWAWLQVIECRTVIASGPYAEGMIFHVYRLREGSPIYADYGPQISETDARGMFK